MDNIDIYYSVYNENIWLNGRAKSDWGKKVGKWINSIVRNGS